MKISCKKTWTLEMDADDWELYDNEGREAAARDMSNRFEQLINSGIDSYDVYKQMSKILQEYETFGAADSEGYRAVERILEKVAQ